MSRYVALLRGINVSGHHKVPMVDLKQEMGKLGFTDVVTILNSGNVIFDAPDTVTDLDQTLAQHLEQRFGFPIPTITKPAEVIQQLLDRDPFQGIEITKDTRLYVSFLKQTPPLDITLPWSSEDGAFRILDIRDDVIVSVLDLSVTNTPKAMEVLEKWFGKPNITTRNWNTMKRIEKKL